MNHPRHNLIAIAGAGLLLATIGCGSPNKVSIGLRKEVQDLRLKNETLQRQHDADVASLATTQPGSTTRPSMVDANLLNELFTVSSIDLNKLTSARPDGLKVYVTPKDAAGDTIKMAGAITVDAFDLANKDKPQIGHWEFPAAEAGKNWYESIIVRGYALTCPVMLDATTTELTVRVSFLDTLTERTVTAQKVIPARVPDSRVEPPDGK